MHSKQSSLPPFLFLLGPLAVTPELRLNQRGGSTFSFQSVKNIQKKKKKKTQIEK